MSLAGQAFEHLQQRITDGLLPEGSRLVIDQLAREFGVSLIPIREALARLHAEKLVEYHPNKGYRVAKRLSDFDLKELFDARLMIEKAVVDAVVKNLSPSLIQQLRALNDKIAAVPTGKKFSQFRKFVDLNDEFHSAIVQAAGNNLILHAYKGLSYGPQVARELFGRGVPDLKEIIAEHERIVLALESRDAERTRQAISSHIVDGLNRLLAMHSAETKY